MFRILFFMFSLSSASYHEQYRVPQAFSDKWESFVYNSREYIIQNLPVNWENAKILCGGHHNGTLAIIDSKEKAEFLAEALSESQFDIDAAWVGARRHSADDPAGYRWNHGVELRRTALDVLVSEFDSDDVDKFPVWLNRTHVPVPESGADCVGLERVRHDHPVFLDLPCDLERPFVCEKDAKLKPKIVELKTVRCRTGLYRVFDGKMEWGQAASYCLLRDMILATVETEKCLKKLGMAMLKTRPSIEGAWIGARGALGKWNWLDSGATIFHTPPYSDAKPGMWPPMRDRSAGVKQSGCLQLDRHDRRPPVFLEARCDRKMQFICYQGKYSDSVTRKQLAPSSDDMFNYILVRQLLYWQHAFENCLKMNGTLANLDNNDILIQLLMIMGENKEEPVTHVWISGRLNMTRDAATDAVAYIWTNPNSGTRIPDTKAIGDASGLFRPPWLDEEFSMDSPCLNLDRQDHLNALVYGLPCDTAQYSICMIEKDKPVMRPTQASPAPIERTPIEVLEKIDRELSNS